MGQREEVPYFKIEELNLSCKSEILFLLSSLANRSVHIIWDSSSTHWLNSSMTVDGAPSIITSLREWITFGGISAFRLESLISFILSSFFWLSHPVLHRRFHCFSSQTRYLYFLVQFVNRTFLLIKHGIDPSLFSQNPRNNGQCCHNGRLHSWQGLL